MPGHLFDRISDAIDLISLAGLALMVIFAGYVIYQLNTRPADYRLQTITVYECHPTTYTVRVPRGRE